MFYLHNPQKESVSAYPLSGCGASNGGDELLFRDCLRTSGRVSFGVGGGGGVGPGRQFLCLSFIRTTENGACMTSGSLSLTPRG